MTHKISGAVMLYALFISIMMLIITSLILGLSSMNSRYNQDVVQKHQCRNNVTNALILAMARPDIFPVGETTSFSLFGSTCDSVSISHQYWGLFEILTASSSYLSSKQSKTVFVTNFWDETELPSLCISTSQLRCKVGGATIIEGQCQIPSSRFDITTLDNIPFTGHIPEQQSIGGPIRITELPDYLTRLTFENILQNLPVGCEIQSGPPADEFVSFDRITQVSHINGNISIDKGDIAGNQIIICDGIVHVAAEAKLEDIIIIAHSVLFDDDFKGNLQVFARDSIITGRACRFNYPSAFMIYKENKENMPAKITIGNGTTFEGTILCWSNRPPLRKHFLVTLSENSMLIGNTFCNDLTELNGQIKGHVITRSAILHLNGSVYENTLFNCSITFNNNIDIRGFNLLKDSKMMKIVKSVR